MCFCSIVKRCVELCCERFFRCFMKWLRSSVCLLFCGCMWIIGCLVL